MFTLFQIFGHLAFIKKQITELDIYWLAKTMEM